MINRTIYHGNKNSEMSIQIKHTERCTDFLWRDYKITKLIERQQRRSILIERYNIFMNRKIQCFKDVITPNIDLDL